MNDIFPTVEALLLKVERRGVKIVCSARSAHSPGLDGGAPHECAGGDMVGWDKVASVEEKQGPKEKIRGSSYQMGLERKN